MTSLIGRQLGRYVIRAELGRGGMARVYRALDTQLQRQVALKVLAAQLSLDDEFIRRFEREATIAANLRHPAIVTIYDVGEQDGLHYIAMELVTGRSLHAILHERTTLGLGYALSILDPVARALDYAHTQGAVHRDIKPHNILIDQDGRVLLTDFGIAQTPDSDGERLTRTGVFMGTPEYISPEQAEAQRVDGRSDLYSLAVVAYEIITGRVPFAGPTPQLIVAHVQLPPPPPTSVLAHLPSELDEVMARALAKRPAQRYPTGTALIEALRKVAERYGTPLATQAQLAALVDTTDVPPAPYPAQPLPPPRPPAQAVPPVAPMVPSSAGQPTTKEPTAPPDSPGRPQVPPRQSTGNSVARPAPARPVSARPNARGGQVPMLLLGGLLVTVTLALILAVSQGMASNNRPGSTATPTLAIKTRTLVVPTVVPQATQPAVEPPLLPTDLPVITPVNSPRPMPPTLAPKPPTPTNEPAILIPEPPTETAEPPTETVEPASATPEPASATPKPPAPTLTPIEETPILGSPIAVTPIIRQEP